MFFYADLHIHSKYSRATSKSCNLEELAIWAQKKGLSVISTGDFTHPAWFSEIKEKLVPAGPGVFRLREDIEKQVLINDHPVRFLLSVEISTIYKKGDKTRKVHHVVFAPDFTAAQNLREKLAAIGNIVSDGRPILGLDSRDLLEITLSSGEGSYIIPAHIWTPWFSALGSKSGFDSIQDCYADLAGHIFAVETGLSSDPEMNWQVSSLDNYRLVSNSDAHSPSKLAREATVFDTEPDYFSIMKALKTGEGYVGTVEFFPEEGKYHEDGHRKCDVCLTPEETIKLNGICPVCHKPLTIGVMHRVNELADRKGDFTPPATAGKVFSLVPLQEILSEIMQVGVSSKSVVNAYEDIIRKLGPELKILRDVPVDEISKADSPILGEAISRLREGKVIRQAGFDGEYGVIRLFEEDELVKKNTMNLTLDIEIPLKSKKQSPPKLKPVQTGLLPAPAVETASPDSEAAPPEIGGVLSGLDENQLSAAKNITGRMLIVAGPGSGKTRVLTRRIAHMVSENDVSPQNCLAITFTRRAAKEMQDRLDSLLPDSSAGIHIHTFHSLCLSILKEIHDKAGLNPEFRVANNQEKISILTNNLEISEKNTRELLTKISKAKRIDHVDESIRKEMALYQEKLSQNNMLDFDDLIVLTVKVLSENPDVAKTYRERFKYISVDEYQDIDAKQYELIKLLAPPDGNLCAIGDPNQAIYGFRGGDSKFFRSFTGDYPGAQVINLKNNYRSTGTIVDASNQMINSYNITAKFDKPHEKITIHTAPTDKAEAEFVVSTIEKLIGGHSFFSMDSNRSFGEETDLSFSDFAVLFRASSQLEPLVEAFQRSGMPFVKLSNDSLCDKKEIQELLGRLNDNEPLSEQLNRLSEEFSGKIDDHILKYLVQLAKTHNQKGDFIEEVSLLSEIDTLDQRADRISLLTLHSSKGLEFKCVFIAGLENEIMPLYRAQDRDEIEEERRLFYVGMTRAEQRLFLSRAVKRKWQGTYKNLDPSPFLKQIQNELLNLSKFDKPAPEKDKSLQLTLF